MKSYFVRYQAEEFDIRNNRSCGVYEGKIIFSTDKKIDKSLNSEFMKDLKTAVFGSSMSDGFEKSIKVLDIVETMSSIPSTSMDPFSIEKEKNTKVNIKVDGIRSALPLVENEIAEIQSNDSPNGLIAYESLCRIREAIQKYIEFKNIKNL